MTIRAWEYWIEPYCDHHRAHGVVLRKEDMSDAVPKDQITWHPLYGEPVTGAREDAPRADEVAQLRFEEHCFDGQKCGATTTGCRVGQCQRKQWNDVETARDNATYWRAKWHADGDREDKTEDAITVAAKMVRKQAEPYDHIFGRHREAVLPETCHQLAREIAKDPKRCEEALRAIGAWPVDEENVPHVPTATRRKLNDPALTGSRHREDKDRLDAERFRWIVEQPEYAISEPIQDMWRQVTASGQRYPQPDEWRAAIDAARAKGERSE